MNSLLPLILKYPAPIKLGKRTNTETAVKFESGTTSNIFCLAALLALGACGGGDQPAAEAPAASTPAEAPAHDLVALLASDSRAEADRARDAGRKPAEVIAALGIKPGMNVIDVIAASGYYTEVLSLAVGPDGHVDAQNPDLVLKFREGANDKAMNERLAGNRLSNVSRLDKEIADLSADDGPYDAAITALNLHDIYNRYGEESAVGALQMIGSVLKPGGVFGVIDHDGAEGNDNEALHRMQKADAVRVAKAAGFTVEESGILHVHSDDLSQMVFAEGVRGNTHRFLLILRKP
jgi:predicted methyltransferase